MTRTARHGTIATNSSQGPKDLELTTEHKEWGAIAMRLALDWSHQKIYTCSARDRCCHPLAKKMIGMIRRHCL